MGILNTEPTAWLDEARLLCCNYIKISKLGAMVQLFHQLVNYQYGSSCLLDGARLLY
jgi:hypothetical protein